MVSPSTPKTASTRSIQIPIWGKVVIMMAIVFLASIGYMRSQLLEDHEHEGPTLTADDIKSEKDRQALPEISLADSTGARRTLSSFKGKVVLLSFWASWCAPCLVELPTFKELHSNLADKGLEIVPINVDDNAAEAKVFIENFWGAEKLPFPTFFDLNQSGVKKMKVDTLPANFVIDRKGRLVFTAAGANDWSKGPTADLIEMLLKEPN